MMHREQRAMRCGDAELIREPCELVSAEGTTALRRARLVDSFNKGYRGYARTYRTCTKPALQAIDRFMEQGASITDGMMQSNR